MSQEDKFDYSMIGKNIEEDVQYLFDDYDNELARKVFLDSIDISAVNQEAIKENTYDSNEITIEDTYDSNEIKSDSNVIESVTDFKEAVSNAQNGDILTVDTRVLGESIQNLNTNNTEDYHLDDIVKEGKYSWNEIVYDVCKKHDDFLIAFYIVYINLGSYSRHTKIDYLLSLFNDYYYTNYKDVEDILEKNNLGSLMELKKYVDSKVDTNGNIKMF